MKPGLAFECAECLLKVSATGVEALDHLGDCSVHGILDSDFSVVSHYTYAKMHA